MVWRQHLESGSLKQPSGKQRALRWYGLTVSVLGPFGVLLEAFRHKPIIQHFLVEVVEVHDPFGVVFVCIGERRGSPLFLF